MRTFLRGKVTLLFMMLGMLIAIPAVALAAELVTSELDTVTPNDLTVEQGGTTNFNIGLTATGAIANTITSANPSTATVDTSYSINNTGAVSGGASSLPFDFFSSGTSCGGPNCDVTWNGAPTPYSVGASVSAASTTPVGVYDLVLSDSANTTDLTNPSATGGKLGDTTGTTITVHVVAATPSDTTGPSITITTPPAGATYLVNEEVLADYACTDPSGVATCVGNVDDGKPINTNSVTTTTTGPKSFTVNATDTLDNASSLTHNYNVRAYTFDGFSSPVDNPTVLNAAKAGQAIPLKWRLTDNGSPVTDLAGVTVTAVTRNCTTGVEGTDAIEQYAAGSSGLQNLGDGYYQFNWKSPTSFANSCKTLTVNGIGVQQQAYFQFKK